MEQSSTGRAQRKAAAAQATRRKQLYTLAAAVVAAILVAAVLILVNRPQQSGSPISLAAPLPPSIPLAGTTMGEAKAPVSIVEWGDYQCPGCGIFAREIAPRLVEEYVQPGQIQFSFHDFAFLGKESIRAAEAAACAADQDAFWPYHDTLYANQHGENLNAFSDDRLKQIATELKLDAAKFNTCLDSGEKQAAVEQSSADARSQGITSTPSILVNGTKIDDWQNWETVKQTIDAAIGKK